MNDVNWNVFWWMEKMNVRFCSRSCTSVCRKEAKNGIPAMPLHAWHVVWLKRAKNGKSVGTRVTQVHFNFPKVYFSWILLTKTVSKRIGQSYPKVATVKHFSKFDMKCTKNVEWLRQQLCTEFTHTYTHRRKIVQYDMTLGYVMEQKKDLRWWKHINI